MKLNIVITGKNREECVLNLKTAIQENVFDEENVFVERYNDKGDIYTMDYDFEDTSGNAYLGDLKNHNQELHTSSLFTFLNSFTKEENK